MSASGSRGNPSSARTRTGQQQQQLPGHAGTIAAALEGDSGDDLRQGHTPLKEQVNANGSSRRRKSRDIVDELLNDPDVGLALDQGDELPPPPDYYSEAPSGKNIHNLGVRI